MNEYNIGQEVIVESENSSGKIVGFIGDMFLVRFNNGVTVKYYPHELYLKEE